MATNGYAILDLKEYGFEGFNSSEKTLENPEKYAKKIGELKKLQKPILVKNIVDDINGCVLYSAYGIISDDMALTVNRGNVYFEITTGDTVEYKCFELQV